MSNSVDSIVTTPSSHPESANPGSTDNGLLEGIRARDEQAWTRFVDEYSPLIYVWCRKCDLQSADARDVSQQVFHAVSRSIATFSNSSDKGTFDGQHFFVMELVQGADSARVIHDRGPLHVADACKIVRQAAIGLQHAHDNGLVHRDVKPSNIMLALDKACRTSLDMPSADVDVTDDVSFVVSRTAQPQDDVNSRRPFTAITLGGLFLALVAAVVYYIVTNNGIVKVEVMDDSFKVAIDDRTVTVNEGNDQPIKLWPGEHKLVVSVGETELITGNFEISCKDKLAFRVELLKGEVVVSKGGKRFGATTLPNDYVARSKGSGQLLYAEHVPGKEQNPIRADQPDVLQPTAVPGLHRLVLPSPVLDVSQDEKMALLVDAFGIDNIPVGIPRVWSLQTNTEDFKLPALEGFYLRFVPGERPLCMAGDPRRQEVRFWDIEKGSWHGDWIGHDLRGGFNDVFWPIFSPDGETVSIASQNGRMQFWNLRGDKPVEIKPPVDKPLPKSDASKPFYERQFSSGGKYCFAIFDAKLYVLDPATATTVAGPFPHQTARDLGISWPNVLYNTTSETLVTIESSDEIRPATLRFRSAKKNWEIAHSATVTGKVGSVSFLGPNHVLSGGLGTRKAEWGGQTAQHISTIVSSQPGSSSNEVLERDAYTYAFVPDGIKWVGMSTSSVYAGRLGQKEIAWRQPLPRVFKDNHYMEYQLSIENPHWVVSQRTKNQRVAVAAYSLQDGRLLLDKRGLKHAVHVKSTIALGREVFRYSPRVAKTSPAIDLRSVQKMVSVPTEGKTTFKGVLAYHAKAQLSKDTKTALVESGAMLQMWNLETGQLTSISKWGGRGGVVGFVPEANLAWHAEHGVEFWDVGKSARTALGIPHLTGPSESTAMPPAFSEDGKLLATQTDVGKFRLWNLETQKPLSPAIEAGTLLYRLTFSPDGKWLFTEDKSGWCIWNVATQKRVAGPLMDHLSDRNTDIAVSPDSSSIAAIEGKLPQCEIVIRVAQGETWKEYKRIPISNPVEQTIWVDSQHLAIVVKDRNQTYGLKVISIDELEVQDYGYLRTFDKIMVAPDRQHFVVSNYAAVTCWKLGLKEHLWKIGTSEAGRSHDVHFGKDWVLLHEKGATTGARPAIVRSLNSGNEVFRKENVIATAVNGANICLVDATGIEVWRVNHDEIRSP